MPLAGVDQYSDPLIDRPSSTARAPVDETSDVQRLAEYLKALANPNRLALLHALRVPQPVRELDLHPASVQAGENPERRISHQAVRDHLSRLRAIGVITVRRAERDGALVDHFVLDHQKLFAIVEELRQLGELRSEAPLGTQQTLVGPDGPSPAPVKGPRLLLVRGQNEGRVFALTTANQSAGRGWVVGRKPGLAIALDYDPFVSTENAEVVTSDDGYALLDLRSSRNGTWCNFERVGRGQRVPLEHGDIISVGRTHLAFHVR